MANIHELSQKIENDDKAAVSMMELCKPAGTIDTFHNDEGLKVLAEYDGDQAWEPSEERSLVRKVDLRLLPLMCGTYAMSYYDKVMISQAALFGFRTDLDLEVGNRYSFAASIYYLGFVAGAYPAILAAQRYPVERIAALVILVWGACQMTTAACHNYQGLYAIRFFLGFLEAGVPPMFMLIVGGWYNKHEQAFRLGIWYSCTSWAGTISPLINYGLGHINGAWSPWRYMYLFAGAITVIWSFVILFFLPTDPIRAKGFSARERYIGVARLRINNAGVRNTHFKKQQAYELIIDIKFWLVFAMAFLLEIANGPVSTFIPLIVASFGFNELDSLLLSMPSALYGAVLVLIATYLAYKSRGMRTYIVAACSCGTVIGAALLWKLPKSAKGGLLFATCLLPSFASAHAVCLGLQLANTAGYTKRSLASSGVFLGFCFGNFVGPLLFMQSQAPVYTTGFISVILTSSVVIVLAFSYRFICIWENRKRDKAGTAEAFDHAYEDDVTDRKNPQFRYTY